MRRRLFGGRGSRRGAGGRVRVKDTLARIDHSVWELGRLVAKNPESFTLRADFLKFFHESRIFIERKVGVSETDRSFLYLQNREALCCLLMHGAGGSPAEMRDLAEHLFQAGYTVYGINLALGGNGSQSSRDAGRGGFHWRRFLDKKRAGAARSGYNWERCLLDTKVVLGALLTFSPNTYVVGFSFGGTIALNLMQEAPVKGGVLISPALFPAADGRYLAFKLVRSVVPFAAKGIVPKEYTLMQFLEKTRSRLKKIQQPILVIHAARERIVSPKSLHFLKSVSSNPKSRFELLPSDRHVLVKGEDAALVYKLCAEFLKQS
jgi:carboxylesterase